MKSNPKTAEEPNQGIEKRLHRVLIKLDGYKATCPYSKDCNSSEDCSRCNEFYNKCSKYKEFFSHS